MVLASAHLTSDEIRDLSWQLEKLDVDLVVAPGMVDVAGPRLTMRLVAGLSLIHVEKPQYSGTKRFQKRAFDIAFSLTVLIAAAPVMIAAALAIKLTSPGPVFYLLGAHRPRRQAVPDDQVPHHGRRRGQAARRASLTSTRSGGVLFKIREDPRVTSVGRSCGATASTSFRSSSTCCAGDMSVVGPRPPLRSEVDTYDVP